MSASDYPTRGPTTTDRTEGVKLLFSLIHRTNPDHLAAAVVDYLTKNADTADHAFFAQSVLNHLPFRGLRASYHFAKDMLTNEANGEEDQPTVHADGYGVPVRTCSVCGDDSADQTGECADWCSPACADVSPTTWVEHLRTGAWNRVEEALRRHPDDLTTEQMSEALSGRLCDLEDTIPEVINSILARDTPDEDDACNGGTGGHHGECDECLNGPAGFDFSPQSPIDEENEADAVKAAMSHAVNTASTTYLRLFTGVDDLPCPMCGCRLHFSPTCSDFSGGVEVSCDCFGTVTV